MDDLSILVVSWNTRELTSACLRSIRETAFGRRAQTVVVDNASSDGSAEAIRAEFPWVELVASTSNLGFSAGNNLGLGRCRGRYVLLLNPDTLVLGDVLERSVAYLDANPDVGAMGCRVLNPDRTLQSTCFRYPSLLNLFLLATGLHRVPGQFFGRYDYRGWLRDSEMDVDVVTGCYLMVRGSIVRTVGPLDERFFFCGEETDWCLRIRRAGHRVVLSPVGEIIHFGNQSGRQLSYRRDVLLSEGLVKLHAKHSGLSSAACAWLLLLSCNALRAIYWTAAGTLTGTRSYLERGRYFAQVTRAFDPAWMRSMTSAIG